MPLLTNQPTMINHKHTSTTPFKSWKYVCGGDGGGGSMEWASLSLNGHLLISKSSEAVVRIWWMGEEEDEDGGEDEVMSHPIDLIGKHTC